MNKNSTAFQFLVVALHTVGTKIPVKGIFRISMIFRFVGFTGSSEKKCKTEKCVQPCTCASSIDFLGFNLSENGIKPLPNKVKCILNFPKPNTLTQLRRFWGVFNFYRKLSEPLPWNENTEQAFLAAKNAIAEATLLRHTIPGAQLSLWMDASDIAIGGTSSQ
ncbi:transposon Ty3-I Gag-Pol polyprotein [Trichonephila clavipes]|nr:transposon Ty3-I Gag-Pol polyprotein [Trichonephila clavipes]